MEKVITFLRRYKTFLIVSVAILLSFAYFYFEGIKQTEPTQQVTPQEVATPKQTPPAAKITVGDGVFVDNFKVSATPLPGGDSKLIHEDGYEILYLEKFDSFLISILKQPFEVYRQVAETALLSQLGISQTDACRLDVTITTPAYVDPALGGNNFSLSFCE